MDDQLRGLQRYIESADTLDDAGGALPDQCAPIATPA